MTTPHHLEREYTLLTAAARYNELRMRDALAPPPDEPGDRLTENEALEMLALGEVLIRKASYGRQLGVRSARGAGAPWARIGAALGTTRQSAWEAHTRWIDEQARHRGRDGTEGLDTDAAAAARDLAGKADE
jgi:hypothetical protein